MKDVIENLFGFLYTLSMGDYLFFIGTFIIILSFIYVLYLILKDNNQNEDIDYLKDITKSLENNYKPDYKNITEYEKEQEESAIISYEELIKNKNTNTYEEEFISNDEVMVKKISINPNNCNENKEKLDVKLLSYNEYEDFLIALKQLQHNLIN